MARPPLWKHLRDILIAPFSVTVVLPWFLYTGQPGIWVPESEILVLLGTLFLFMGLALLIYTIYLFRKLGEGTLAPWEPTQQLVIRGPYRYCRNPMITGVFFILIAETLVLHSDLILIYTVVFFLINTLYFKLMEEPGLVERFGEAYKEYRRHVPMWLPRFSPYKP
jgi:protein-S-isoprenylcysteine O-methyltransferase Ste14